MSIRNDKFWAVTQENELGKAIFAFIKNNNKIAGLSYVEQNELAGELMQFIEEQKQRISNEVEKESQREDVLDKINAEWRDCKESVSDVFPIEYLDKLIAYWREELGEREEYWKEYWDPLICILQDESWYPDLEDFSIEAQLLYKCYLKNWFLEHNEGEPVCIEEFISNEMEDQETAQYYWNLVKTDTEWLAMKIVEKGVAKNFTVPNSDCSLEVILAAKHRFNLDLQAFLNGDDFNFMHDYIQLHQHYHKDSASFDNRFVPRYARPKQK